MSYQFLVGKYHGHTHNKQIVPYQEQNVLPYMADKWSWHLLSKIHAHMANICYVYDFLLFDNNQLHNQHILAIYLKIHLISLRISCRDHMTIELLQIEKKRKTINGYSLFG